MNIKLDYLIDYFPNYPNLFPLLCSFTAKFPTFAAPPYPLHPTHHNQSLNFISSICLTSIYFLSFFYCNFHDQIHHLLTPGYLRYILPNMPLVHSHFAFLINCNYVTFPFLLPDSRKCLLPLSSIACEAKIKSSKSSLQDLYVWIWHKVILTLLIRYT